jgi:hypothetical protein
MNKIEQIQYITNEIQKVDKKIKKLNKLAKKAVDDKFLGASIDLEMKLSKDSSTENVLDADGSLTAEAKGEEPRSSSGSFYEMVIYGGRNPTPVSTENTISLDKAIEITDSETLEIIAVLLRNQDNLRKLLIKELNKLIGTKLK